MKLIGLGILMFSSLTSFATPCVDLAKVIDGNTLTFTNYSADGSIREQGSIVFSESDIDWTLPNPTAVDNDLKYNTALQFSGMDDIIFESSLSNNSKKPESCLMAWWLQPGYFYDAAVLENGSVRLTRDEFDSYILLE